MDALTPVDLLRSFPVMMYVWSAIILTWGVVAGTLMYKLSKNIATYRQTTLRHSDRYTLLAIAVVNAFLLWYLIQFNVTSDCTSWIVVINVFYTAHLLVMSVDITRWWNSLQRGLTRQRVA